MWTNKLTNEDIKKPETFESQWFGVYVSDLGRIQTCNLLSRNQMRYSVAPRGRLVI